jgi:hypothetical protein
VKAPILVDFWNDNFKVLVEARSGALHIKTSGEYWLLAHNSTDEAEGTLPTNRPPPLESPARIPEHLLGGENIYEPHDVDMGMFNDFRAELCSCSSFPR